MKIAYPKFNTVSGIEDLAILHISSDCGLEPAQIADKDVPYGIAYRFFEDDESPPTDFSNPDGYGTREEYVLSDQDIAQEITQYIRTYRQEKEKGGITINGVLIHTDPISRSNLLGARELGTSIDWRTDTGFITLTPEQVSNIATLVGQHIQRCFTSEKIVTEQHNITPYTSFKSVKEAFDTAYISSNN